VVTDDTAIYWQVEFQILAAAERRVVSSDQEARDQVLDNDGTGNLVPGA
jgi:hypothetical protein